MPVFQIHLLPAVLPGASLPLGEICHEMLKGHSFFNPERLLPKPPWMQFSNKLSNTIPQT